MSSLVYRKIRKSDYSTVKELINEAFKFKQYTSNSKVLDIFLETYLRRCLLVQNYSQVVEENGEVIGLLLGKANNKNNFLKNAPNICSLLICWIRTLLTNKEDKAFLLEYKKVSDAYANLIKECNENFDGEVVLFIVGEKCRGKGIGRRLVNNYLCFCKNNNVTNLYLFTDSKCNYGFYDNNGFKRMGEKQININTVNGPSDLGVYLYSYKVGEYLINNKKRAHMNS